MKLRLELVTSDRGRYLRLTYSAAWFFRPTLYVRNAQGSFAQYLQHSSHQTYPNIEKCVEKNEPRRILNMLWPRHVHSLKSLEESWVNFCQCLITYTMAWRAGRGLWERKRNRTPSASPTFRQAGMTLTIQFPIRQKILTIALLAIACMLIAYRSQHTIVCVTVLTRTWDNNKTWTMEILYSNFQIMMFLILSYSILKCISHESRALYG